MSDVANDAHPGDPHNLSRFLVAQEGVYDRALAEVRNGLKMTHWMWFIFPQVAGLGSSPMSQEYAIKSRAEAAAYLDHPVLGPRLVAIAEAALELEGQSARAVFGSPDDKKLRSSATLFAELSPVGSVFHRLLEKYFGGEPDRRTLQLLGSSR